MVARNKPSFVLVCTFVAIALFGCNESQQSGTAPQPATSEVSAHKTQNQASPDQDSTPTIPPDVAPSEGRAASGALGPDLIPPWDQVLIRFDRPLEELRKNLEFGIFRAIEPPTIQWITERSERVSIGDGDSTHALKLHYEVPGANSYNGWSLKLKNADWTRFGKGTLTLRVRLGDKCTRSFKLELKTNVTGVETWPALVRISDEHVQEMRTNGFFDLGIPMQDITGNADLSRMHELVIVFENNLVDQQIGDLFVHSIRLGFPDRPADAVDAQSLLDQLARKAFRWFEENRHEATGLILDRSPNSSVIDERPVTCSVASVGYYLSMLPEAIRQGQIERSEAEVQVAQVLTFVLNKMDHHHGLLYHFVNAATGEPSEQSEVSALDSAIFFNGCMVVSEAFGGRVRTLADTLLDRADWAAFEVKHPKTGKSLLALGWSRKKGLLGPMDVRSSEMAMPYFLAVGSRSHPIPWQYWYNTDVRYGDVLGQRILNPTHPLFTSYYGLGWHHLKGLVDKDGVDLENNAWDAALANRQFCRNMAKNNPSYAPEYGGWWGISAGDSPDGYVAPGLVYGDANGTVWPIPALAAMPWIHETVEKDIIEWQKSAVWGVISGPYGLAPFNLKQAWIGRDLIGIDLGSFYINLANHRNGTVNGLWMRHPVAVSALDRLGFCKPN